MDKWVVGLSQHFKKDTEKMDSIVPELPKSDNYAKNGKNECFRCVGSIREASTSRYEGDYEGGSSSSSSVLLSPLTRGNRSSLRSRRTNGRELRPLSSLDGCLTAQLFKEHVEREDYMFRSFGSPRALNATDGSKVISSSDGAFVVKNGNPATYLGDHNVFSGVPSLPDRGGRLSTSTTIEGGKYFNLSFGSSHAKRLLCFGMSLGLITSFMENKREIEKLNGLLKHTENLVQDLHDELEMKDALIVQEINTEHEKSQPVCNNNNVPLEDESLFSVSQHDLEEATNYDNREVVDQKLKSDSLSNIEAELEAELEMLEMNITSSSRKRRLSNLVELEPDDDHSANYAVSPRELSLRLHEVLESQLEERIRELEAEIQMKQTQNHKSFHSWKHYENPVDEPVVLNLSGEALDAYSEAYDQISKVSDSEEEGTNYGQSSQASRHSGNNWTPQSGKGISEDEMEKMLIQHIVEKAKKGSPAVLKAQRALFSMDFE